MKQKQIGSSKIVWYWILNEAQLCFAHESSCHDTEHTNPTACQPQKTLQMSFANSQTTVVTIQILQLLVFCLLKWILVRRLIVAKFLTYMGAKKSQKPLGQLQIAEVHQRCALQGEARAGVREAQSENSYCSLFFWLLLGTFWYLLIAEVDQRCKLQEHNQKTVIGFALRLQSSVFFGILFGISWFWLVLLATFGDFLDLLIAEVDQRCALQEHNQRTVIGVALRLQGSVLLVLVGTF